MGFSSGSEAKKMGDAKGILSRGEKEERECLDNLDVQGDRFKHRN